VKPQRSPKGEFIWLAPKALKRLDALRRLAHSSALFLPNAAKWARRQASDKIRVLRLRSDGVEGFGCYRAWAGLRTIDAELSVIDHHFDQFCDLVPREVTRI
jgi:hypothetical protein